MFQEIHRYLKSLFGLLISFCSFTPIEWVELMSTPGYACPSVVFWTLRKYTKLNKKQPGICLSVRHWPPANGPRIGPFGKEENPYT
jgi:hypothetical protein